MKLTKVFIVFFIFFAGQSFAGSWATNNLTGRINFINTESDVVRVNFTATDIGTSEGCGQSNVVVISGSAKNQDRQFSILMAALLADRPVKIFVNGCYSAWGTSFPQIAAIYLY